jgi:uncharacterized protein YndB with AHSA1/START domain
MELNETIYIERAPIEVFDAWARIDRAARHDPAAIERTKLTDGAVGPGSRFRAVDRWPGLDVSYTVEITAFHRPERIAATWSNPLSGGWDTIFEPRGEGTELRFHGTLHPSGMHGFVLRLLWPWYRRQARAFLDAFGADLGNGAAPRE